MSVVLSPSSHWHQGQDLWNFALVCNFLFEKGFQTRIGNTTTYNGVQKFNNILQSRNCSPPIDFQISWVTAWNWTQIEHLKAQCFQVTGLHSAVQLCSTISRTLRLYSRRFSLYMRAASEFAGEFGFGSHSNDCKRIVNHQYSGIHKWAMTAPYDNKVTQIHHLGIEVVNMAESEQGLISTSI